MPKNLKNGRLNGGSGEDSDDSDPWDDALLIKAYAESIRLAKEDVAKKVASATNTHEEKVDESAGRRSLAWHPVKFKVGDFVRAVYRDDGKEYEAVVVSTSGGTGKCLIKFIGYENEQYVPVTDLKDSLGAEARMEQIEAALGTPCATEDDDVQSVESEEPVASTSMKNPEEVVVGHIGSLPPLSFHPPLPAFANDQTEEGKHLADMLIAWYTSGYYAGLYDAHKTQRHKIASRKS
uniref:Putative mrna splicing protein smn survival motor neuron n=1 Tax=Nyssomyia neivai TaxID=330878 RepID=A0A1L8DHA3_9DIPT